MATSETENTEVVTQISTQFGQLTAPVTTSIPIQTRPAEKETQNNATITTVTQISRAFEQLTDPETTASSSTAGMQAETRTTMTTEAPATMTAADMEMAIMLATIDQKVTKLCETELKNSKTEAGYITGFIEGDGDALEKFLRSYYAVTGTSFVRTSIRLRSQPGTSKRFGQSDGKFYRKKKIFFHLHLTSTSMSRPGS